MIPARQIANVVTRDRSKQKIADLAERMIAEGIDFDEYFDVVDSLDPRLRWYMTWTLSHYVERVPNVGCKGQRRIWEALQDSDDPSVRRDLWRSLSFVDVDEDIGGEVFEAAVQTIVSSGEPIGVRAHAMYVARNIARPYEELRQELRQVLEELSSRESAAIRYRKKRIISEFSRDGDLSS